MGRRRKGRDVSGILLLDKPRGITSNQALQRVKRLFFAKKAGHTGSLDPLASGLLPICLGHATKVSAYLLDSSKQYEVTALFGTRTTTGDADGEIAEQTDNPPDLNRLDSVLESFRGEISQIPPMYSALRHKGKRLYELARKGEEVERPPRNVSIYEIECLEADTHQIQLRVLCSKGTYIRTLVEDIAVALGTLAHVTALRRTGAGPYDGSHLVTFEMMEARRDNQPENLDQFLLPVDTAVDTWPRITLDADTAFYLLNGQAVRTPGAPAEGLLWLYHEKDGLIGIGEIVPDGMIAPKRLFQ